MVARFFFFFFFCKRVIFIYFKSYREKPKIYKKKKRRFSHNPSFSNKPVWTSMPACFNIATPLPLTFSKGSVLPITTFLTCSCTSLTAQGGVLP